ncbi:hypothetical protein EMIT019CA3_320014 [Bacillus pseudomycoides]
MTVGIIIVKVIMVYRGGGQLIDWTFNAEFTLQWSEYRKG